MANSASTARALAVVRQRLDETAAALAKADLNQLLACEAQLQAAVAALQVSNPAPYDHAAYTDDLREIRALVGRCRRLGTSMMEFVHITLDGIGTEPAAFTFRHSA